jgi:hypothetical protein
VFPVRTRKLPESIEVEFPGPVVDFIGDIRAGETMTRIKEIRLNFFRSHKIQLQQDESSLSQFRRVSRALDGFPPFVPVVVIGMVEHRFELLSDGYILKANGLCFQEFWPCVSTDHTYQFWKIGEQVWYGESHHGLRVK